MKLKSFVFATLAATAIFAATPALATVIQIDSMNSNGTSVDFSAGNYLVSWADLADHSNAWTAWSTNDFWLEEIYVTTDSGASLQGNAGWHLTPGDAQAAAQSLSFNMNLAYDQSVNFKVADSYLGDNSGTITLDVTAVPVPEPEAYSMILAGLGVIGLLRRRKHSKTN